MSGGSKIEDHYPTMSMQELKDLPVKELTNKDSLIYMWATNPFLEAGMQLAEHWGFQYKTVAFIWDKQKYVPGYYTGSQCEICLVFKKKGGKIPQPRGTRNERQFLSEERREHSRKPDAIRHALERMHPTQSKLEMFARTAPEGWDVWGNQTDKFTS
jgi:N6-adenosine-specific RNA methylase IME4